MGLRTTIWKLNGRMISSGELNGAKMLDLDLLRSFVSVVDTGGFTRAGERVHRTQSTVSQQIRRLEENLGYPLLHRNGKQEAREAITRPASEGVVRVGVPEDFAAYRLTELLSDFVRSRPGLRLDVRCGLSMQSRRALERGELDLALFKREAGERGGIASWPERLHWVTSKQHPIDYHRDPLPLVMADQGCLYRNRMVHAIEAAGRAWHIAYTSHNLAGIQAAVSVGLGVSILPEIAILPEHRVLKTKDGFPTITNTEVVLAAAADASPATRRLAEILFDFCSTIEPRKVA